MSVETGTYISDLDQLLPAIGDPKSEGDDHIRLLKSTVKASFPNVSGAVTPTHTELNFVDGVTSSIQGQFDAIPGIYATKENPVFTGTVTAPTPSLSDPSTTVATLGSVNAAIAAVNSQTPLVTSIETSSTVSIVSGVHHVLTNVSLTTCTAPATPSVNDRFRISVANGLATNVINWNGKKHESLSDATTTLDAIYASAEFQYINSAVGWKVIQ